MGRICHDLELKTTPNGVSVLSFRIAVDRNYQVKGEERKADFFNIVAWRGNAEFVSKYFGKGRMILVNGELQTRQYVDKNNITVNVVEIVSNTVHFTGEKANQTPQSNQAGNYGNQAGSYGGGYSSPPPPAPHPAEVANTAPAAVQAGSASDFADSSDGDEDDYPF